MKLKFLLIEIVCILILYSALYTQNSDDSQSLDQQTNLNTDSTLLVDNICLLLSAGHSVDQVVTSLDNGKKNIAALQKLVVHVNNILNKDTTGVEVADAIKKLNQLQLPTKKLSVRKKFKSFYFALKVMAVLIVVIIVCLIGYVLWSLLKELLNVLNQILRLFLPTILSETGPQSEDPQPSQELPPQSKEPPAQELPPTPEEPSPQTMSPPEQQSTQELASPVQQAEPTQVAPAADTQAPAPIECHQAPRTKSDGQLQAPKAQTSFEATLVQPQAVATQTTQLSQNSDKTIVRRIEAIDYGLLETLRQQMVLAKSLGFEPAKIPPEAIPQNREPIKEFKRLDKWAAELMEEAKREGFVPDPRFMKGLKESIDEIVKIKAMQS